MKKIKVLYVFNHSKITGGGELSFIDLINEINNHQEFKISVLLPGDEDEIKSLLSENIKEVYHLKLPNLRTFSSLTTTVKFIKLLKYVSPDIVHVNGARAMVYAGICCRLTNIPCIWHVRVVERDKFLDRIRYTLADHVITNSKTVAHSLAQYTKRHEKISVIYNGFNIEKLKKIERMDIKKFCDLHCNFIAGYTGRLSSSKRVEDLIIAIKILQEKKLDIGLIITGKAVSEEDKCYEKFLKELAINSRIKNFCFLPWTNEPAGLIKALTVSVLPSAKEGFGRIIVESWACKVPVIAASSDAASEIINDGKDGLLVKIGSPQDIADKILKICNDTKMRDLLINNGLKRVEEFSIVNHVEKIKNIYKESVKNI